LFSFLSSPVLFNRRHGIGLIVLLEVVVNEQSNDEDKDDADETRDPDDQAFRR
jgi:hypothetical protein